MREAFKQDKVISEKLNKLFVFALTREDIWPVLTFSGRELKQLKQIKFTRADIIEQLEILHS